MADHWMGSTLVSEGPKTGLFPEEFAALTGLTALRIDAVDLSHHQSGNLDFVAASQAGVRGVWHKATEGVTVRDVKYVQRRGEVREVEEMAFGAYHFAWPDGGDADDEAYAFLEAANPNPRRDLRPVLDFEINPLGLTQAERTEWLRDFASVIRAELGLPPMLYTPFDFDEHFGCPLWVARYHNANAEPRIPSPWVRYRLRQFSNGVYGVPNEVDGLGHVDLNHKPDSVSWRSLSMTAEPNDNPTLKIGHGNGRNQDSLVRYVRQANADSFSAQEAQRLLPPLEGLPNHRVIVAGEDWTEQRNRAKSTSIITHSDFANIGEFTRKVSERIPAVIRVAPDRVLVASFFEHPVADAVGAEGIAHFALHPDAGPQQLNGDNPLAPIVREYRESLQSTKLWMESAMLDKLVVVLTGDLQVGARHNKPWGPRALIQRPLGLQARVVNIDWIMIDPRLRFVGPLETRELFDHTGFVATIAPRD